MGQSFTQWQYVVPYQQGGPGVPQPFFRDGLDSQRAMYRRTPSAEYPDGYLGTIVDRREDRMYSGVAARINQRSYQRGVHKGERIDPGDYTWSPDSVSMQSGISRQKRNPQSRYVLGGKNPIHLASEGRMSPRDMGSDPRQGNEGVLMLNPKRVSQLKTLLPRWR